MDEKTESIQDLFNKLAEKPVLKDKLFLNDDKLTIVFGEHYKIDVTHSKSNYRIYINNLFFSDIDELDIAEILTDISENEYYIVEKRPVPIAEKDKDVFVRRQKHVFLSKAEFSQRKERLFKTSNIILFNQDKILYEA